MTTAAIATGNGGPEGAGQNASSTTDMASSPTTEPIPSSSTPVTRTMAADRKTYTAPTAPPRYIHGATTSVSGAPARRIWTVEATRAATVQTTNITSVAMSAVRTRGPQR